VAIATSFPAHEGRTVDDIILSMGRPPGFSATRIADVEISIYRELRVSSRAELAALLLGER